MYKRNHWKKLYPQKRITELKTCFPKFSELEANINCMFDKLANIGIYDEVSTKFKHEVFEFEISKYHINPRFAIILQYENYDKAKFNKKF